MAKYRVYLSSDFQIVPKEQATQIKEVDGDVVRFLQVENSDKDSVNAMKAMKWDDTRPLTEQEMNELSEVTPAISDTIKQDLPILVRALLDAEST